MVSLKPGGNSYRISPCSVTASVAWLSAASARTAASAWSSRRPEVLATSPGESRGQGVRAGLRRRLPEAGRGRSVQLACGSQRMCVRALCSALAYT